jgi:hypothetical protein
MTTQREINAGYAAVRRYVDATSYGRWISDQICIDIATAVLQAAEHARELAAAAGSRERG